MASDQLPDIFRAAAKQELEGAMRKIEHCASQLSDAQLWWRPTPDMNSIANLMLHLAGNVRQYLTVAIGGAPDRRNRPMEFADQSNRPKAEILALLQAAVNDGNQVIAKLTGDQLSQSVTNQGKAYTTIGAIFHCLAHFVGHTQEIIHLTRRQLGDRYRFDYVPSTPAQISESGPAI